MAVGADFRHRRNLEEIEPVVHARQDRAAVGRQIRRSVNCRRQGADGRFANLVMGDFAPTHPFFPRFLVHSSSNRAPMAAIAHDFPERVALLYFTSY
jgi:hypothetical protein